MSVDVAADAGVEADEHLVQHHVVEDLATGQARELLGERPRVAAAALDELGDARAPERAERGIDGEPARPP